MGFDFDVRVIPQLSSMIVQLIATVLLYLLLRHFLYEPVSKFMNDRKSRIKGEIDDAKTTKEEALELKEEYETRLSLARKESQEIVESARKRGEEVKDDIVNEAKKEAQGIVEKAQKEIQIEKEKALEEIKLQVADMAVMGASKILGENLDAGVHKDMIDKFIDEVGESKWQN